jgi:hypothetical protein
MQRPAAPRRRARRWPPSSGGCRRKARLRRRRLPETSPTLRVAPRTTNWSHVPPDSGPRYSKGLPRRSEWWLGWRWWEHQPQKCLSGRCGWRCRQFEGGCRQLEGGCRQLEGGCRQAEGGCRQVEGGCRQTKGGRRQKNRAVGAPKCDPGAAGARTASADDFMSTVRASAAGANATVGTSRGDAVTPDGPVAAAKDLSSAAKGVSAGPM